MAGESGQNRTMKKLQIIDLVRTFSIVAVMADHSYSNPIFSHAWMAWIWGRFCVNGSNGVLVFFLVSGFLITGVLARDKTKLFRPDVARFYVQRIGRIWPLYFTLFLLGILIFLFGKESGGFFDFLFPRRTLDPWFWWMIPTFTFNWYLLWHPDLGLGFQWLILWSLSVEEQFYLVYPLILGWTGKKERFLGSMAAIGGAAILFRVIMGFWGPVNNLNLSYPTPAEFDLFVMGILLYFTDEKWGPYLAKHRGWSLTLCTAGFLLALITYFGVYPKRTWGIVLFPDGLGLGTFGFLLGGSNLRFFESPWLKMFSWPGKYCYGAYLLHPLVLFFIGPLLGPRPALMGLGLFVVATTMIAALSFHFFELPINLRLRSYFDRVRGHGVRT